MRAHGPMATWPHGPYQSRSESEESLPKSCGFGRAAGRQAPSMKLRGARVDSKSCRFIIISALHFRHATSIFTFMFSLLHRVGRWEQRNSARSYTVDIAYHLLDVDCRSDRCAECSALVSRRSKMCRCAQSIFQTIGYCFLQVAVSLSRWRRGSCSRYKVIH